MKKEKFIIPILIGSLILTIFASILTIVFMIIRFSPFSIFALIVELFLIGLIVYCLMQEKNESKVVEVEKPVAYQDDDFEEFFAKKEEVSTVEEAVEETSVEAETVEATPIVEATAEETAEETSVVEEAVEENAEEIVEEVPVAEEIVEETSVEAETMVAPMVEETLAADEAPQEIIEK